MGRRSARFAVALLLGLLAAVPATAAALHIYSYDSATPITRKMTEGGLTFMFQKTLMGVRVVSLVETHDVGAADLKPAGESSLGSGGLRALLPPDAHERDLYEIVATAKDGKALTHGLCGRNADRGWLAFGRLKMGEDLRVQALGHDSVTGKTKLCATLDYSYHGEWALPPAELPQPSREDRFNDSPANRRY